MPISFEISISPITVTITPMGDSGGGGATPPVELAFADFKNGVYRLNGANVALGDLFVEDANFGNFAGASDIVAGEGLATPNTSPVSSAALWALLVASGFTAVVDFNSAAVDDSSLNVVLVDLPGYSNSFGALIGGVSQQVIYGGNNSAAVVLREGGIAGLHKLGFSWFPNASLAGSLDGEPVGTTIIEDTVPTAVGLYLANSGSGSARVESIAFYSPVADTDLPALSA